VRSTLRSRQRPCRLLDAMGGGRAARQPQNFARRDEGRNDGRKVQFLHVATTAHVFLGKGATGGLIRSRVRFPPRP
jgi:hypothetical protein